MMNMDSVPWCEKYRVRSFADVRGQDLAVDRKIYKGWFISDVTSSDVRSIFPGDLRVARCFFSDVCWRGF